jgi:hypothetical protein
VFFLPRMHERYAIVGEVLLLCWAVWAKKPRALVYVLLSMLPVLSAYSKFLFTIPFFSLQLGGVMNLCLLCLLSWEVVLALRACAPADGENASAQPEGEAL